MSPIVPPPGDPTLSPKPSSNLVSMSTVHWGKASLAFDVLQLVSIFFLGIDMNLGLQKSMQEKYVMKNHSLEVKCNGNKPLKKLG